MSDTKPWRSGVWLAQDKLTYLIVISGDVYKYKGLIHLDYPDSKSQLQGTLTEGDFGEAPENIRSASGMERFNLKMKSDILERCAVLTNNGTRMYTPSFVTGEFILVLWEFILALTY